MMNAFEKLTVQTAMKKLLDNGTFYISDLEQCLKIAGVVPDGRIMQSLRALHCIKYEAMPRELLDQLPEILVKLFQGAVFDTDRLNIAVSGSGLKLISNK